MHIEDLTDLARAVDERCRLSGQFTLRSGRTATEYFDKYLFEADPVLVSRVAAAMVPLVPAGTDLLGGLELGGIPLVTLLSQATGIPALFVRKEPKPYGTRRAAEGGDCAGRTVTLVEDVITTGGAVVNAARLLRAAGATVTTVVCALDREEPVDSLLTPAGIEVRPALTRTMLDKGRSAG
ncbi:orotate phosphoribosyltransferase [Fodinicola feengrottensis]|uniref:Orotate phosphoribosyltransferase n=1 Tax=Fodinicola feengrottensis TaxID=435914 RepID=A0ABN2H4P3_9ACTN|nr:orotate phosphoribosyltransferase [Fodinicola feengrottensis]